MCVRVSAALTSHLLSAWVSSFRTNFSGAISHPLPHRLRRSPMAETESITALEGAAAAAAAAAALLSLYSTYFDETLDSSGLKCV